MGKLQHFLLVVMAIVSWSPLTMFSQDRNNEDEVVKLDSRLSSHAYRQGEMIVKFKPNSVLHVRKMKNGKFSTIGVRSVDNVLHTLGIEEMDPLMPLTGAPKKSRATVRSVSGKVIEDTDMTQLYRVKFNAKKVQNIQEAVKQVEQLGEVEYAEPNYLVYSLSAEKSKMELPDPLLIQQWGLSAIGLPQLWKAPVINSKRPVIAILDTGVDTEHPDLKDNIWVNEAEQNGAEEADDDNNGFADDFHGWDFVNQTGRIGDWNGHGTHCAGIAGAVGDNGIGIKGANPDALIMPVTVLQSDGVGDVATIIKGLDYAAANGADVINMSFGGYAYSKAEEQALAKAYNKAVLVAAAGNDCLPINPSIRCPVCFKKGAPMFPAAFTFVLGVQAGVQLQKGRAIFSNYDEDGPVFSRFGERKLYNYELFAPGEGIMSTYPGGKYKYLSGTSMASPMVAGAISRLLQCKEYASKELLFGDLIHSSLGMVNIYGAYQVKDEDRKPELALVSYELNDSLSGDNDCRPDAGETIDFYPILRNAWGMAKGIHVSLEMGENEDPSLISVEKQHVDFGKPLSSYAKAKSDNPLRFKINEKCVDGRHIKLRLVATCDNMKKRLEQDIVISVENGVELGGYMRKSMTLYPDVHYIVTQTLAIPKEVTITVKPGTVIKFKDGTGIASAGTFVCDGKPDSMIVFTKADLDAGNISKIQIEDFISYVEFRDLAGDIHLNRAKHCIFKNMYAPYGIVRANRVESSNFFYNTSKFGDIAQYIPILRNCNLIDNINEGEDLSYTLHAISDRTLSSEGCNVIGTWNEKMGTYINGAFNSETPVTHKTRYPSFWGSAKENNVRKAFYDVNYPLAASFGYYDLSNLLNRPSADAHACVWKVMVDGYDAQDQFEELPPLGVGKHKFEVYFNRQMDTTCVPGLYMGVRPPYTQNAIADSASWNADGTVYTAYLNITGKIVTDGLNRIYVMGARDLEHFEIGDERFRFNVEVASAGSLSTGLVAEPGVGKVALKWTTDEADFEDLMGYNICRYTAEGDTVIVNKQLLEPSDTAFVDYDVIPGTTYYYSIKQMTTALTNYGMSNPVAATPLTATKGDANGSMAVDVADVVTEIAWMSNQHPQPFIFEAADVNTDKTVNILDVVGTINIIIQPIAPEAMVNVAHATAQYYVENGILYLDTPVTLGGVQVSVWANKEDDIAAMEDLDGFEQTGVWRQENEFLFLAYSMSGRTFTPGRHALLRIGKTNAVKEIILSDPRGQHILAVNGDATGIGKVENMQLQLPTPNPFSMVLKVPYVIGQEGMHDVRLTFCDLGGRVVHIYERQCDYGKYVYTWYPKQKMQRGLYLVKFSVDGKLMQTAKVIYMP